MGMTMPNNLKTLKSIRTLTALCLIASLAACSWSEDRTAKVGGAAGGILGGVLGSKMGKGVGRDAAIIMGATLGAMWGQDIAKGMTDVDKIFAERTTKDTLEYGKPGTKSTWSNPDSGNSGSVTAGDTYQNDEGEDCRQFETDVDVEGEQRAAKGTACRMSDGAWQVVEEPA